MKRLFFLLFLAVNICSCIAQDKPKGTYYNKELNIRAKINLNAKDVPVPGMEDVDSCYGYLQGSINGQWFLLKIKSSKENTTIVRVASERGADAEDIEITDNGKTIAIKQVSDSYIKGVANNKYVKLPKPFILTKE